MNGSQFSNTGGFTGSWGLLKTQFNKAGLSQAVKGRAENNKQR